MVTTRGQYVIVDGQGARHENENRERTSTMSSMQTAQNRPNPQNPDTDRAKSHIQELKKDAAAVRDDLVMLKDDAVRATSHVAESATNMVRDGSESATELFRNAGATCKKYHGAMSKNVVKHPTASVLAALGAGVLIGRLLGGR